MTSSVAATGRSADPATRSHRWDLDVLRVLAILGVVATHTFGLILGDPELRGSATWAFAVALDYGVKWCVPVFVMISGALLLQPSAHRDGPEAFWRKRLVRLLPALVVWHVVYVVIVRHLILGRDIDLSMLFIQLVDAKVFTALYFLWLILGLYAVAPILAAFLARGGERRAVGLAVAATVWTGVLVAIPGVTAELGVPRPWRENALTMWIAYVGLFVAGYAWREARATGRRWIPLAAVGVVLTAFNAWQAQAAPDPRWLQAISPVVYYSIPVVVASVCLFVAVIDLCARLQPSARVQRVLRVLGEATFGVFLTHLLFLMLFRRFATDFYLDPAPVAKTLLYLAVLALAFATSLLGRRIPVVRRVF